MQKKIPFYFLFLFFMGCSGEKSSENFSYEENLETSAEIDSSKIAVDQIIQEVTASQLAQMISLDKAYLLDCRTLEEYNQHRIGNAIHFDLSKKDSEIDKLNRLDLSQTFYLYSNEGVKLKEISQWLINQGVSQIYILNGGIQAWENAQLPFNH